MSNLIPQMAKLIPQKLIPQQLTLRQLTPHQAQLAGFYQPNELTAEPPIEQYIVRSKIVIGVLFGGFGLWAAFVPLTSAAVAPGVVKVDSYRKTVQHLEGGIVSEILVHDGDAVVQGQPLVRLDDADAEADLNSVRGQIGALEAETSAIKEQLPSFEEQLADERGLFQKGYAKKSQIFELERTVLKMKGDVEANENRLTSLREQQAKARAKTERNVVTAPQDGVVMNLRTHTPGGVIAPGGDVLDLVPSRDKLVLEVKVQPIDIDVVRPDLPAMIHFVAYKQRTTPVVEGKVTRVSADAVAEERTGLTYFLATVEVGTDQLARAPNVKLYPGMPVEAAIVTGSRTMLAFLLQPFTDSFSHAFREE